MNSKFFNNFSIHNFKRLQCDICKRDYPDKVKYKGKVLDLLEITKPLKNYIVLEYLQKSEDNSFFVYVIDFGSSDWIHMVSI